MTPAPKHCWPRFSLRTFLVAVPACGILFTLLIAFVIVPYQIMEGHPVSMAALAKVSNGMTEAEVRRILGDPQTIKPWAGRTLWTYHGKTWCVVRIRFDGLGTVEEIDHDH